MPTEVVNGLGSVQICTKCHQNPRADTDGTNPWCKECRAEYAKVYEAGKAAKMKDLGFSKGAEAMRRDLLKTLAEFHPTGVFSFAEAARWIKSFPAPRPD